MTARKAPPRKGKKAKRPAARPGAPTARGEPRLLERRAFWIFLAAATLATLVFFGSFVTDREAMIFGTDMVSQAYQSRAFAVQEVQAGRGLPQWNPFVFGGLPYLSILPYPVYYPTSLLYFVMALHRAIGWAFVLHFLLAGVLAYGMARELRLGPGPAVVTGAAYMFTGYLVSHLHAGQDGRMFAMTWTPALFLLAERAVRTGRMRPFAWMAVVVALQLFTPHVQMTYFAGLGVSAFLAFRLVQLGRERKSWRPALPLALGFVGAYALAGLVALAEILPTRDMLQFSHRIERGYDYASSWSMPVQETLGAAWPGFQGYLDTYWGTNPFKLHTEYLGAATLVLALVALVGRRSARTWFFAGLAVLALLFAWGGATPVHRLVYWTLPVMKSFRAPGMMYSVVALAAVVLAGLGAQTLLDRRDALRAFSHPVWRVTGGLGILFVVLWFLAAGSPGDFGRSVAGLLYGSLEPDRGAALERAMPGFVRSLGIFAVWWWASLAVCLAAVRQKLGMTLACFLLAGIAVADLWRVDDDFYETFPVTRLTATDGAVRFLKAQTGPLRVLPLPTAYGPNDLMLHRIEAVTGSQNFRLRWWDDLVGEDLRRLGDTRLWRLLNVRYLISGQPIEAPGLELVHEGGGPPVYGWEGSGPAAWVVHEARSRPDGVAPGEAVLAPGFDPGTTALLEPGVPSPPTGEAGPARVRWIERQPARLVLEVESGSPGILVLSEIYHPYWSARVDDRPVDLLQVDVALRGVPIGEGRQRVTMEFRDPMLAAGRWGSVAGLVLLAGAFVATRRRPGPAAVEAR
ncbi:MAG TPA: hypothetical protein VJP59_01900 [Gemmatimonadota bacterium]|nr:hypothetical protein [Gemmatimonadota bacterium]